ncbi:aromatic amino acid transport family protein, partial [Erwinia sp. MYb416]
SSLTAALTYLPPALLCIVNPDGFISALAYAGIALVIWSVLLPPLLLIKARKAQIKGPYQFPASNAFLYSYFVAGFLLWVGMLYNMIEI